MPQFKGWLYHIQPGMPTKPSCQYTPWETLFLEIPKMKPKYPLK